ncbi:uncharacterized protein LOC124368657 [Homalodisca vitripennis]|uniref:MARVEL domain-containing protein n=1 Tax=Homalodisca liturata TaxID=320908 RepID=A0A1B6J9F1_9HEMI|nr:uncharacterized protein LOC124368657 [Homalodisca vitripennis]XP_046681863.1 uncharacterized protein LOC124368657 [Homalodisca vitripennis]
MTDYLRSPVFQLKCVELLLGLVAIAFIIASATPSTSVFLTQVVHFTLFGYSLLDLLVIGGFFLREPVSKFLILVVSLSGALFSFVSAIVLIVGWSQQDLGRLLISAIATILNTIAYAGDSYYIIRFSSD